MNDHFGLIRLLPATALHNNNRGMGEQSRVFSARSVSPRIFQSRTYNVASACAGSLGYDGVIKV